MMIFETLINGIAAACLTTSPAPDYVTSASLWCQEQQQQYVVAATADARSGDAPAAASKNPEKREVAPNRWYTSWNSAWQTAREQGRPLVCLFVHEGCPECDRMNATLRKPAAATALKSAVKVKLEFNNNPTLVQRWGIKYTPTFLVFSPAHNSEVYREVGALSVDRLRTLQPSIEGLVTQPDSGKKQRESSMTTPDSAAGSEHATASEVAAL